MYGNARTGLADYSALKLLDVARKVQALPDKLQRAVIAEYALGGTVPEKLNQAGASKSAYYRRLEAARERLQRGKQGLYFP